MDEEQRQDLQELLEKVPGMEDFLSTLNQTQWESEKDAAAVIEALSYLFAAVREGKPLRPQYLH